MLWLSLSGELKRQVSRPLPSLSTHQDWDVESLISRTGSLHYIYHRITQILHYKISKILLFLFLFRFVLPPGLTLKNFEGLNLGKMDEVSTTVSLFR